MQVPLRRVSILMIKLLDWEWFIYFSQYFRWQLHTHGYGVVTEYTKTITEVDYWDWQTPSLYRVEFSCYSYTWPYVILRVILRSSFLHFIQISSQKIHSTYSTVMIKNVWRLSEVIFVIAILNAQDEYFKLSSVFIKKN